MEKRIYTSLQIREVFHLEFLRWFSRKLTSESYCLKGGVNLRFFFKSIRYSQDVDIDVTGARVETIKKTVMEILCSRGFCDSLKSFGIEKIGPPDMEKAKQTQTTQRFQVHLLTSSGQDLFTKIDFSRRAARGNSIVEQVAAPVLRFYKMAPLLVSHYDAGSAVDQKIHALAHRSVLQARDIFDLFWLSCQCETARIKGLAGKTIVKTAHDNIFQIGFAQYRDTVVAYLADEDQKTYATPEIWDEIKLKTASFLEEFMGATSPIVKPSLSRKMEP